MEKASESAENTEIIIAVLNARYSHPALGVRYLLANMGELREKTRLMEFNIKDNVQEIAEKIIEKNPLIAAFSISIWNSIQTGQIIKIISLTAPHIKIIAGGPELRWINKLPEGCNVVIRGEGETVFPDICRSILNGADISGIFDGMLPDLNRINLPYAEYTEEDIKNRIMYVEASRGCPYQCEFCLSSREKYLRKFPLDKILSEFSSLIERGATAFKFIDRTFNLDLDDFLKILDFFYEKWPKDTEGSLISPEKEKQNDGKGASARKGFFLHFEVVPGRFSEKLINRLALFPAGGIQLEMGIQTFNNQIGKRIKRIVEKDTALKNIKLLKEKTGVYIHADLIIGLPGESEESIAESFDTLYSADPHEIQIGILKLLPGAPIKRHSEEFSMVYNPIPPYDILQNNNIDFLRMRQFKRLSHYYDIFVNSGKFRESARFIMQNGTNRSAFFNFKDFSDWLYTETGKEHAFSQSNQYLLVFRYLSGILNKEKQEAASMLINDFLYSGNIRYMPEFLRKYYTL